MKKRRSRKHRDEKAGATRESWAKWHGCDESPYEQTLSTWWRAEARYGPRSGWKPRMLLCVGSEAAVHAGSNPATSIFNWKKSMRDVSRESPCPICGRSDWCLISDDGEVALCNRTESDRPAEMGWIHFVKDPAPPPGENKPPIPKLSPEECERIAKECYRHPDAAQAREALAGQLGVSVDSLERLRVGVGHDWDQRTWTSWPCRDAAGTVIGLTRRYGDGSKKTYPGTRAGLFYSLDWSETPGVILIVEGGSDVAACITYGHAAIGRPSNTGGAGYLSQILAKHPRRPVLVVAERDFKPERRGLVEHCPADCSGCANCWPGLYGAKVTAERLGIPLNWILPRGGKDFREASGNGADLAWVRSIWSAS